MRDSDSDSDPDETREWLDALEAVGPRRRARARAVPAAPARGAGAAARHRRATCRPTRRTATRSRSSSRARIRATSRSRSASRRSSAGTRSRWSCARTRRMASSAATSRSYASAAEIFEVGFNHFFRGATTDGGGDLVFFQPHSAPGVYARAFLEGRLSEEQLANYRQEVGGGGLSSYPHPWLMPDFWQFPTGSMGIGPISAIYQARFMRYLRASRHRRHRATRHVWGVFGDGEMDEPESIGGADARRAREARQPDLRHQLQPAAARRSGARQRPDHPGAGDRCSAAPAGTSSRCCGARTGTRCSRATRTHALLRALRRHGRRRVPDARRQRRRLQPRAFLRPGPGAARSSSRT